jgi:hypothetical protein
MVWPDGCGTSTWPGYADELIALLESVKPGDALVLIAFVGGGGGHRLTIRDLKFDITFSSPWRRRRHTIMWRLATEFGETIDETAE